jgi:hypothetical protein
LPHAKQTTLPLAIAGNGGGVGALVGVGSTISFVVRAMSAAPHIWQKLMPGSLGVLQRAHGTGPVSTTTGGGVGARWGAVRRVPHISQNSDSFALALPHVGQTGMKGALGVGDDLQGSRDYAKEGDP